ncbi:hypothetical protein OESDEN_20296, partial [Oesophagostomum dentatum]
MTGRLMFSRDCKIRNESLLDTKLGPTKVMLAYVTLSVTSSDRESEEREVEATVCLRATQRLAEYEKMLEDLSQRRSNALVHNETEQAERILMAMADCRDTVFRAIHVDLLLGRGE